MKPVEIAIKPPHQIRHSLNRICFGFPSITWFSEDNLYLILRHISPVDGAKFLDIKEALITIRTPPFKLSIQNIAPHHSKKLTGELRAGIASSEELNQLLKIIDSRLKDAKIENNDLQTIPHIKLGRYQRANPQKLAAYLEANGCYVSPEFLVEELLLISTESTEKKLYFLEHEVISLVLPATTPSKEIQKKYGDNSC